MEPVTQEIPRESWRPYFDGLSKTMGPVEARVEVAGTELGDQVAAEGMTLVGITYDDRDDVVVIGLDARGARAEELQHLVERPQRIFVATGAGSELVIDIEDSADRKTIVRLDRPAALSGGQAPADSSGP
jgi:hypothetical protein